MDGGNSRSVPRGEFAAGKPRRKSPRHSIVSWEIMRRASKNGSHESDHELVEVPAAPSAGNYYLNISVMPHLILIKISFS